jgi:hypothetical protein
MSEECSHSSSASHCLPGIGWADFQGRIGVRFVKTKGFCRLSLVLQEGIAASAVPFLPLWRKLISISPTQAQRPDWALASDPKCRYNVRTGLWPFSCGYQCWTCFRSISIGLLAKRHQGMRAFEREVARYDAFSRIGQSPDEAPGLVQLDYVAASGHMNPYPLGS